MRIEGYGNTDVGLKREINQDSILVDEKLRLYAVADGMGGHKGGEIASSIAIEKLREFVQLHISQVHLKPAEVLRIAFREASSAIFHKATVENPELMGMGTTLVGIMIHSERLFIANVGDSRVYLSSGGHFWQLTEDHSLINEQVRAGVISEEDAPFVIARNVITRSVGFEREVEPDILERKLVSGDVYLICSDGLSTMVSDAKLAEILKVHKTQEAVAQCINEAKKGGGEDNISAIVVRII